MPLPESALCSYALGTAWWDQKQGKPNSNGRSHTVISDGQLDLVAGLFHAQHHTSRPARESMLDRVRRQLIDEKAEGYGTIGVDIQRFGLDLDFDAGCVS